LPEQVGIASPASGRSTAAHRLSNGEKRTDLANSFLIRKNNPSRLFFDSCTTIDNARQPSGFNSMLIVDIEATCWEGNPPSGQESEIIEIGICTLSLESGEVGEKHSILVRPQRSTVSEFCTKLTTLTQEQVDKGVSFETACQILRDQFDSANRVWGSWGDYDRKMF